MQGFEINALLGSYQPTQTLGQQKINEHGQSESDWNGPPAKHFLVSRRFGYDASGNRPIGSTEQSDVVRPERFRQGDDDESRYEEVAEEEHTRPQQPASTGKDGMK